MSTRIWSYRTALIDVIINFVTLLQACPFIIDVYTEDCDDAEFKVAAIEEMMDKLQRPLCQSVMEKVWTLFHNSKLSISYRKDKIFISLLQF